MTYPKVTELARAAYAHSVLGEIRSKPAPTPRATQTPVKPYRCFNEAAHKIGRAR